jgi:hypothetical protein
MSVSGLLYHNVMCDITGSDNVHATDREKELAQSIMMNPIYVEQLKNHRVCHQRFKEARQRRPARPRGCTPYRRATPLSRAARAPIQRSRAAARPAQQPRPAAA